MMFGLKEKRKHDKKKIKKKQKERKGKNKILIFFFIKKYCIKYFLYYKYHYDIKFSYKIRKVNKKYPYSRLRGENGYIEQIENMRKCS